MNTKMKIISTVKIAIVIYPSITLFLYLFGGAISDMPLYLRTLLITILLVPWMVFIGLPFLNLLLGLLFPKNDQA